MAFTLLMQTHRDHHLPRSEISIRSDLKKLVDRGSMQTFACVRHKELYFNPPTTSAYIADFATGGVGPLGVAIPLTKENDRFGRALDICG